MKHLQGGEEQQGKTLMQTLGAKQPVKWCLKEKVLLRKWSAIAMLELQRIRFAGWELTEGQQAISKFSLQVLQPLPGIQKGIFEIQVAGNSACRLTVVQRPFPRSP